MTNEVGNFLGMKEKIEEIFKKLRLPPIDIRRMIKSRPAIQAGLDIGAHSLKLVEISLDRDVSRLDGFQIVEIEEPSSPEKLISTIRKAALALPSKIRQVNISLAGPEVIVRYVELPRMTEAELKGAISFEAEKYIPFNINEVTLDYQVLEPKIGENRMRVLLVAVQKAFAEERLALLEKAGLDVNIIDINSFALINSFYLNYPELAEEKEPFALLDIGDRLTSINILRDGLPYFTREIQIGGRDFAGELAKKIGIKIEEAVGLIEEARKRSEGFEEAVRVVMTNLSHEIQLSFGFYEDHFGKKVEKVYLSGGMAKLEEGERFLTDNLGVEVLGWDVLKGLRLSEGLDRGSLDKNKEFLAIAIGLARRR